MSFIYKRPDNEISAELTARIDELLKAQRQTRKWLAMVCGISQNTISSWETRGSIPSAKIALYIAQALHTSVEYLMTGHEGQCFDSEEEELLNIFRTAKQKNRNRLFKIAKLFA